MVLLFGAAAAGLVGRRRWGKARPA